MAFSDVEIQEFKTEAEELLDSAEDSLLSVDRGAKLESHYDAIFRVFHSLKGAASMMELQDLQSHMHQLENIFTQFKSKSKVEKFEMDFFLRGVDAARKILQGQKISFDYDLVKSTPTPATPKPEQNEKIAPNSTPHIEINDTKKLRGTVMLIDDEPELVTIIENYLKNEGFSVLPFTNPELALAEFKRKCPDVIISDICMPQIDGIELLKSIRQHSNEVPVLFISGFINKDYLLKAIELGVYTVFEKPLNLLYLLEATINASHKHQLTKLLNSSINLIMYQYSDLDAYLANNGKDDVRKVIRNEISTLVSQRNLLRSINKAKGSENV